MLTKEELRAKYGTDYYFVVGGNYGQRTSNGGMSEEEAIREYESRRTWSCSSLCGRRMKPKATYIVICVPSDTLGRVCYRGWIDEKRYRWDTDEQSLRVERLA